MFTLQEDLVLVVGPVGGGKVNIESNFIAPEHYIKSGIISRTFY